MRYAHVKPWFTIYVFPSVIVSMLASFVCPPGWQVCRRDPSQKSRFVRVLLSMLQSRSAAVSYEAAWTLVSLSGAPTAIRAVRDGGRGKQRDGHREGGKEEGRKTERERRGGVYS